MDWAHLRASEVGKQKPARAGRAERVSNSKQLIGGAVAHAGCLGSTQGVADRDVEPVAILIDARGGQICNLAVKGMHTSQDLAANAPCPDDICETAVVMRASSIWKLPSDTMIVSCNSDTLRSLAFGLNMPKNVAMPAATRLDAVKSPQIATANPNPDHISDPKFVIYGETKCPN